MLFQIIISGQQVTGRTGNSFHFWARCWGCDCYQRPLVLGVGALAEDTLGSRNEKVRIQHYLNFGSPLHNLRKTSSIYSPSEIYKAFIPIVRNDTVCVFPSALLESVGIFAASHLGDRRRGACYCHAWRQSKHDHPLPFSSLVTLKLSQHTNWFQLDNCSLFLYRSLKPIHLLIMIIKSS